MVHDCPKYQWRNNTSDIEARRDETENFAERTGWGDLAYDHVAGRHDYAGEQAGD